MYDDKKKDSERRMEEETEKTIANLIYFFKVLIISPFSNTISSIISLKAYIPVSHIKYCFKFHTNNSPRKMTRSPH